MTGGLINWQLKLQRIHNLLARTVVNVTWSVNVAKLLAIYWLVATYQTANSLQNGAAYKARHSTLPLYLQYLLLHHHPAMQLWSSFARLFLKPAVTYNFASCTSVCPNRMEPNKTWPALRSVDSLGSFKTRVKEHTVPRTLRQPHIRIARSRVNHHSYDSHPIYATWALCKSHNVLCWII